MSLDVVSYRSSASCAQEAGAHCEFIAERIRQQMRDLRSRRVLRRTAAISDPRIYDVIRPIADGAKDPGGGGVGW